MKPILLSFFLLFSLPAVTGEEEPSDKTLLHRALAEGNIHAFRIEMGKLLDDPVPDFFKSIAAYMTPGVMGEYAQIMESKGSSLEFLFDNLILSAAFSFPLEKTNKDNLTARDIALNSYNLTADIAPNLYRFSVHAVLTAHNNDVTHGLYDEEATANVWRQFSQNLDVEENPWKQLSKVHLSETPLVQALLNGELGNFMREWRILFKGPAKHLFALLHSSGKDGETFFHYAAEFLPKHLQGIDKEDLTPEQKKEIIHAQRSISFILYELFGSFPPAVRLANHLSREIEQRENPIYTADRMQEGEPISADEQKEALSLLKRGKRVYAIIGAAGIVAGLTAASSQDELIAVLAGVASGLAIEGAFRCYDKFKSKSTSKSGNR